MAAFICIVALFTTVIAAHPAFAATRFYQGLQQPIRPIDYFLVNSEAANYYTQPEPKQGSANAAHASLETLDPDSEVELVPGVQQPQPQPQPPQQNPMAPPNLPGYVPGQRVFIVHMPVPGYRPGTIGGYQPVYIVAASPQGNPGAYPVNGYQQNAILLDPSVHLMPVNHGIYRPGPGVPQQYPGFLVGRSSAFQKPYDVYSDPPNVAYQQPTPPQGESQELVRLTPQVENQPANPTADVNAKTQKATPAEPSRVSQASENKERKDEPRRYRPVSSQQPSPRPS